MAAILKFYPKCHHFQPSYKMTAFHHPWAQWLQGRNSLSFLPGPLVMATWLWSPLPPGLLYKSVCYSHTARSSFPKKPCSAAGLRPHLEGSSDTKQSSRGEGLPSCHPSLPSSQRGPVTGEGQGGRHSPPCTVYHLMRIRGASAKRMCLLGVGGTW